MHNGQGDGVAWAASGDAGSGQRRNLMTREPAGEDVPVTLFHDDGPAVSCLAGSSACITRFPASRKPC